MGKVTATKTWPKYCWTYTPQAKNSELFVLKKLNFSHQLFRRYFV